MGADMWRVPASKVKKGKGGSVIQDNGVLSHAVAASSGNYLFSEAGDGDRNGVKRAIMPLALIGMWHEISIWLTENGNRAIENRIDELPDIYMGVCYYTPSQRYKGLFPLHDAVATLTKDAVGFGGALVPQAAGTAGTIIDIGKGAGKGASAGVGAYKKIFGRKKKPTLTTHPFYFFFTYLPSDRNLNLSKIGSGKVKFKDLRKTVLRAMVSSATGNST